MRGVYTEKLKTGGELKVSVGSWSIQYYFPGPDLRYNGTFFSISGINIDQYISAWVNNFYKYQEIKKSIPFGGSFHTTGEMEMDINIGGFADGVCLCSYHMKVNTEEKMLDIVRDYKYAQKRAGQIQTMLRSL